MAGLTAEIGQSRVELPIPYTGEPITVTLDHRFVADFLKVLDSDKTVTIDIEGSDAAALFLTDDGYGYVRSEEHTSELQSRRNLVCRLLLEKKKNRKNK